MVADSARSIARRIGPLLPLLAAGLLVAPGAGVPGPRPPTGPAPGAVPAVLGVGNLSLGVSPGTWTIPSGGAVSISDHLDGVPPGCYADGRSDRWSLPGISASMAWLNASDGPSVTARSLLGPSGFFTVESDVAGELVCPEGTSPFNRSAAAVVTVLPALSLSANSPSPNPGVPGDPIRVGWVAKGGQPPYEVSIDFGDGSSAAFTQSSPGTDSVFHRFPVGVFAPEISVTDALGNGLRGAPSDPLPISYGLSAAILLSAPAPEVGRPLGVNASIQGGIAPYRILWTVNGVETSGSSGDPATLTITPDGPGPLTVALSVSDSASAVGTSSRRLTVTAAPSIDGAPLFSQGEVGRPYLVAVNLSGGVAPYRLSWSISPEGPSGAENLSGNGTVLIAPVPTAVGPGVLGVTVVDALGGQGELRRTLGPLGLAPYASLSPPPMVLEVGQPVAFDLRVVGGVAPFDWSVEPSTTLANASSLSGRADGNGSVHGIGTPTGPGNLTLRAYVLDALGAVALANETIDVAPALGVRVTVEPGPLAQGVAFNVALQLTGGLPPYAVRGWAGDGVPSTTTPPRGGPSRSRSSAPAPGTSP